MPGTENQTLFDASLTTSMTSNDFFETMFEKCLQIIKEMCTTIIKVVENTIFPIVFVEEIEVMHMEDA